MAELARDAFAKRNYRLAAEIYESCLKEGGPCVDLYVGYGNSLAKCGRMRDAMDVFSHCCRIGNVTQDKLKHLATAFMDAITTSGTTTTTTNHRRGEVGGSVTENGFTCPSCEGVLLSPVTTVCGHTFCRKCVARESAAGKGCKVCGHKLPSGVGSSLETNILVKGLVEKWWPNKLKAAMIRDEGNELFQKNLIEQALTKYDQAVQYGPDNHLLLSNRSHALYRLNRFQAALVDAEMVVRLRPNWGKGHYRRGVALSGLGRHEEALVAFSLCVALDRNPGALKLEMTRTLHRLLVGPSSFRARCHSLCVPAPYSLEARLHRGARFLTASHPSLNSSDCEDNSTDYDEDCMQLGMQHLSPNSNSQLQENTKFHNLLDHISQEVEKIKNLDLKPLDLPIGSLKGDQGDFDCVLCCRMLWRPVTTPCGHTYCWMCLDRCLDYSFACPLCMTSLAEYLTNAQKSITEFVDRAMRMTMPNEYRSRQLLHCQEVSELLLSDQERQPEIPVFVCTTAFPGVPCPLFVYEPRYRVMVRRCIEAGTTQFGIAACLNKEGGPKRYAEFGTMLEIRDWVLLSDGCSILTTVGARRFRALARGERDGYDTAQVEFLRDQPVPQEHIHGVKELHERVRHKGRLWFGSILPPVQAEIVRTFGSMPNVEDDWLGLVDGPSWTWWLLAILPLGQNLQVSILGTTSLEKRLRAIDKTLDYIQQRLMHTGSQTCSSKEQNTSSASLSSLNLFSSRDPSQQAGSSRQEQGLTISPRITNTGARRILQRGSRFNNQIVLHPEQSVSTRLFAEESS